MSEMVEKKSWEEFRDCGLLWWINRILHTFGWAIVVEIDTETKAVGKVYPARVKFRGFEEENEVEGFKKVSAYMAKEAETLKAEAEE
jgi:hypothetical protein